MNDFEDFLPSDEGLSPFEKGSQDRVLEKWKTECPYRPGTWEAKDWLEGWEEEEMLRRYGHYD